MAKKKAGERELQIEITTDADWDDLLHKPGLWLVDVYRDWSGPCTSAQGSLKKYKTEVDDSINFATARADNIAALEMFRHTCEPQWVFVAGGEIVGFLRGTNISVLLKMITDLSAHERKVEAGKATRRPVKDLETLAKPERIEVVDPDLQAQEDAEEAAASIQLIRAIAKVKFTAKALYGKKYTIALLKPDAIQSGTVPKLLREINEDGFQVVYQEERFLTEEEAQELYRQQRSETYFANLVSYMTSGPSFALILIKAHDSVGNIINDWREKVGPTNVADAAMNAPRSLRARYGREGFHNAFHASHNESAAQKEMTIIFPTISEELALQKSNLAREKILEYAVIVIRPPTLRKHKKDEILVEFEHEKMSIVTYRRMQISCENADVMHKMQGFIDTMKYVTATTCGMAYAVVIAGTNIYSGKLEHLLGPEDLKLAKANCPCSLRSRFTSDNEEVSCIYSTLSLAEAKLVINLLFPHLTHELHSLEMFNANTKLLEIAQKEFQQSLPQYSVLLVVPHNLQKFDKEEIERLLTEANLEIFCWKVMSVDEAMARKFVRSYYFHEKYATIVDRITSRGPCVALCMHGEDIIHKLSNFLANVNLPEAKERLPETIPRESSDVSLDINLVEELVEVPIGMPALYATKTVLDMKSDLKIFFPEYVDYVFKMSFDCLNSFAVCIISNLVVQHYSKGYILGAFHLDNLSVTVERDSEMTDTDVEQFYPKSLHDSSLLKTKECVVGTVWIVAIYTIDAVTRLNSSLEYGHLSDLKMEHDILHIRPSVDNLMATSEMKVFFPIETTMALIKPDAVNRCTEILELIGRTGLKVIAQTIVELTEDQVKRMYRNKEKDFFFKDMVEFLTSQPCILLALKGYGAVAVWRRLMGPSDPIEARQIAPESIRALFGTSLLQNAVHGTSTTKSSQDCLSKMLQGKDHLHVSLTPGQAPKSRNEAVYMVHTIIPEIPAEERFASFLRKYNLQIEDLMADMLRGPKDYEFPIVKSLREPRIRKKIDEAKKLKTSVTSYTPLGSKRSTADTKSSQNTPNLKPLRPTTSSLSLPRVKSYPGISASPQLPKSSNSSASLPGRPEKMTKVSQEEVLPNLMSTSTISSGIGYEANHELSDISQHNITSRRKRRIRGEGANMNSPAQKTSRDTVNRRWTSPDKRPASQPKLSSASRGRKKLTSSSSGGGKTRRTKTMTNVIPLSPQHAEELVHRGKLAGQRGDSQAKASKKSLSRMRPSAAMHKMEMIANMEKIQASSEKIRTRANFLQRSMSVSKMLANTTPYGKTSDRYNYETDCILEGTLVEGSDGDGVDHEITRASPQPSVVTIVEAADEDIVSEGTVFEGTVTLHEEIANEGDKENEDPTMEVAGGDAVECGKRPATPQDVEETLRNAMLDFQAAMNMDMMEGKTFLERLKYEFLTAATKPAWPTEKRVDTPMVSRRSSQIYGSERWIPSPVPCLPNTAKEVFHEDEAEKVDCFEADNEIGDSNKVNEPTLSTIEPVLDLSDFMKATTPPSPRITNLAKLLVNSRFKSIPQPEMPIPEVLKLPEVRLPEVQPDELPAMEDSFCTSVVSIVFFDIISEVLENIQTILAQDAVSRVEEVTAQLQEAAQTFNIGI